jgi:hypothetical protein
MNVVRVPGAALSRRESFAGRDTHGKIYSLSAGLASFSARTNRFLAPFVKKSTCNSDRQLLAYSVEKLQIGVTLDSCESALQSTILSNNHVRID